MRKKLAVDYRVSVALCPTEYESTKAVHVEIEGPEESTGLHLGFVIREASRLDLWKFHFVETDDQGFSGLYGGNLRGSDEREVALMAATALVRRRRS